MPPLAALFVATVALYLIECIALVPEDAIVLVERRRGGWGIARRGFALGALRRRAVLLSLWPHRGAMVLPGWPIVLAPDGVVLAPDAAGTTESVPLAELREPRADGAVVRWSTGKTDVHSVRRARWLVRLLSHLRDVPENARARAVEMAIGEATGTGAVRPRIDRYADATRWPRLAGLTLFAHLFIIWPLTISWLGLGIVWQGVLIELIGLVTVVCWTFARARRLLLGDDAGDEVSLLPLLLSPPAATRAATLLSRDLLGDVHPLAATLLLCADADRVPLAAHAWRAARFGRARDASAAYHWFAQRWHRALERLIQSTVGMERIATAPHREGQSGSYCPLCWTQYARVDGTCSECDDIALEAFGSGAADADRLRA